MVAENNDRIAALLSRYGAGVAVDCLLETQDRAIAEYVASYLEEIPDAHAEKTRSRTARAVVASRPARPDRPGPPR
jgi:hypothetical protein